MKSSSETVRLPKRDEAIAPVTILDAQGRIVRVVPATEFQRSAPAPRHDYRHERRRRAPRPAGVSPEE
jgi:hypothetical protein